MKSSLACAALALLTSEVSGYDLKFNADGKFRMVQFTDIHFGDADSTDKQNQEILRTVLQHEKPDLIVLTGDMVSGYAWDGITSPWFAPLYEKMTSVLEEFDIPWAMTLGNHDREADLTAD